MLLIVKHWAQVYFCLGVSSAIKRQVTEQIKIDWMNKGAEPTKSFTYNDNVTQSEELNRNLFNSEIKDNWKISGINM